MKIKTLAYLPAVTLLLLVAGCGRGPDLSKNQGHDEVMKAAWQYTAVAKACGHEQFLPLRAHLIEFVQFQKERGTLTLVGKLYFGNQVRMDRFIDQSVEEYQRQPFLSCSSAIQYYGQLMEAIRGTFSSG